jgi:hypothetical protein
VVKSATRSVIASRVLRSVYLVSAPISSNSSNSSGCAALIGTDRTRPANSVLRVFIAATRSSSGASESVRFPVLATDEAPFLTVHGAFLD